MESEKQREYVKQQQQLRAMANSAANKALSADSMIEDLLSKKETFQKRKEKKSSQGMSAWLIPGSGAVHPLYEKIWTAVQKGNFADTPTFSRLLMTSGLSTDSLGFIWSLANQTVAGMMTQQEVYFVLALVALAQTGYIVSNIPALNHFPQPPVPKLDVSVLPIMKTDIPLLSYSSMSTESLLSNISNTLTPKMVTPLCAVNLLDTQANTNTVAQNHLIQSTVATPSVLWGIPKQETVSVQNNEKIGISYVSSGGLSLQDSVLSVTNNFESGVIPQTCNNFSGSVSLLSVRNSSKQQDMLNAQSKQSGTEVLSQSFNNLCLEKSQNFNETNLPYDNCDDEFTDFQSAYTLSQKDESTDGSVKNVFENLSELKSQIHRNAAVDGDDEFTGFQNAVPLSQPTLMKQIATSNVMPISYIQNDKEDKISTELQQDLVYSNDQNFKNESCRKAQDNFVPESEMHIVTGKSNFLVTTENPIDKYQVFHEVFESLDCEDKYSVFHNPLPEVISDSEERTQTVDNRLDFFKTSFFYENGHLSNNSSSLDLPKIDKIENITVEEGTDLFGGSKDETKTSQTYDKYDAFKTSVLVLSNNDKHNINCFETTSLETVTHEEDEEYTDFQSSQDIKSESFIDNSFGQFQTSDSFIGNENHPSSVQTAVTTDTMISHEQILTQASESLKSSSLMSAVEDKYSALRLLEPVTDVDDFGDFLGADTQLTLPNTSKPATESIQVTLTNM